MDHELNTNRLGCTWGFLLCVFYLRALLDRVYARQIQAKCVEAQTQANTPPVLHFLTKYVESSCAQLTFHLWTPHFLDGDSECESSFEQGPNQQPGTGRRNRNVSFLCADRWRWKRWWWTSKHKVEVTWRRRWPRCCRSPELVDQTRLIRTDLRNTGVILTEN